MSKNTDENLTEEKPAREYSEPIKRAIAEGLRRAIPETPEDPSGESAEEVKADAEDYINLPKHSDEA